MSCCQGSKFLDLNKLHMAEIDTWFVQFLGKHNSRTFLGLFKDKLQFSRSKIYSIIRLSLTLFEGATYDFYFISHGYK